VRDIKNLPDSGHLYAAHVIHDIWRITGATPSWSPTCQHRCGRRQYYHSRRPRTLITSGGLGTIGFALPGAIGQRLPARTGSLVTPATAAPDDRA